MPELPEVESIRQYLEKEIVGKRIKHFKVLTQRSFFGKQSSIIGKFVKSMRRKGKVLHIFVGEPDICLSIHLKLSGQLLYSKNKNDSVFANNIPLANSNKMPGKTTRIIIEFDDGSALYFNDLRKFGWIKQDEFPIEPLGVDVLSILFTKKYLSRCLIKTRRPIKTVLLDQTIIAGIGNIYANDSLWLAGIHPSVKSSTLSSHQIKKLYNSILSIINESLLKRGSSAKDELYVLPDGTKGSYQNNFKVYQQTDKPCAKCNSTIVNIKISGRGTFFCPKCQVEDRNRKTLF